MIPTKDRKFVYLCLRLEEVVEILKIHGYLDQLKKDFPLNESRNLELPEDAKIIGGEITEPLLAGKARLRIAVESDSMHEDARFDMGAGIRFCIPPPPPEEIAECREVPDKTSLRINSTVCG